MRGPPIRVTCECGEVRNLSYGERWECEQCGRRWNTEQIPAEQYRGLIRDLRRFRLETIIAAAAILAVLLPLAIFVSESLIFLIPILLAVAAMLYGPFWKRKVRRRIAERPRWKLEPE